jgi:hypothetical protein
MSKKKTQRGAIPKMSSLTPAEQDALMQRWKLRHDLRQTYQDIADMLVVWCIDEARVPAFHSKGHEGYFDLKPPADLFRRLEANGFSTAEIEAVLKTDEVAADWMTPEEVASFLELHAAMEEYFATHDPGPFAQAVLVYNALGQLIRRKFVQQYGYLPEQSPVPRVRIQGKNSELPKLKPADHQPSLFDQEDPHD